VASSGINIDPICLYDPKKDGKKSESIWFDKDAHDKFE